MTNLCDHSSVPSTVPQNWGPGEHFRFHHIHTNHIHHIQAFCNYKNLQLISSSNGEWLDLEPDRGESEVEEGEREPAEEENGDHGDQKFARSKIAVAIYIVIGIVIVL